MANNYKLSESGVRELRLGTIVGYEGGNVDELAKSGCDGDLKNQKHCLSAGTSCGHLVGVSQLALLKNSVVIDHGPSGCSSCFVGGKDDLKGLAKAFGREYQGPQIISTNLDESDTVFGAVDKIKTAVKLAYERHNPDVIFITATCTSAIIGEDIDGIVAELNDQYPIPIGYCSCAGMRSQVWASGFDAAAHAIAKTLVKPPKEKRRTVNFIDFYCQTSEVVTRYLNAIDLEPLYLNSYCSVEDYEHVGESIATTGLCTVLPSYLATYLEQEYDVPYLKTHFGIGGSQEFERWYLEIAEIAGKVPEAEAFLKEQNAIFRPRINELRARLEGKTALVVFGPGFTFDVARLLDELGIKVVHGATFHYDPKTDGARKESMSHYDELDFPVTVSEGLQYETYKLLQKYQPDILVAKNHGPQAFASSFGVPSVCLSGLQLFGYDGVIHAANLLLEKLEGVNFVKKLSAHMSPRFSQEFIDSDDYTLIEEVKVKKNKYKGTKTDANEIAV
ncbi:MAG: hypothetical protein LBN22_10195 [Clostridiales Family XIII bacterium]|jgi:nitrogenase molybdenum-iron protein alpha chain|nr:hypothetical protein [Clostridiales Family XIII bacterium]